jgi:phosphatidylserine decarboxylase
MNEPVPVVSPELPGAAWRTTLAILRRLPQGALSRGFGRLADTPLPKPLRRVVLGTFARAVGIDVGEAEHPFEHYGSLNEFFVRRLKAGARAWSLRDVQAGSPVDGVVGQFGRIKRDTLVQAKGRYYSGAGLLNDAAEAQRYEGGSFLTLYLSPRHYHRIHAPTGGVIPKAMHVPGALLPVNAAAVAHVADLFARNERLLCYIDGPLGRIAVVAVGAYNVGRISAAFDDAWKVAPTNRRDTTATVHEYAQPRAIEGGDEIMAFHLGSTVVLLFEPRVKLHESLVVGAEIRLGSLIAS